MLIVDVVTTRRDSLHKQWRRLLSLPMAHRLASGASWSVIGAILSRGMAFASTVITARVLGKTAFGEYAAVQGTIIMFQSFAGLALGVTATKHVAEYRENDPAKAGRLIALSSGVASVSGLVFAVVMGAIAPWLAGRTLAAPHLETSLRIAAASLFFVSMNSAQLGVLCGMEAFKSMAVFNGIIGIVGFPLVVGGALVGGVEGATWGTMFASVAAYLLARFVLKRAARRLNIPISTQGCLREWPTIWTFAVPSVVASFSVAPVLWVANALLVNQRDGYAELGIFNAVYRLKQIPEMVASVVLSPILPVLSQMRGSQDAARYNQVLCAAFVLSIVIVAPMALMLTASPWAITTLYGRDYEVTPQLVQLLMLHSIAVGLSAPMTAVIASVGRMWVGAVNNLAYGVIYLLLAYVLVPAHRAVGLAIASTAAYAVVGCCCFLYIYRHERQWFGRAPLKELACITACLYTACVTASWMLSQPLAGAVGVLAACAFAGASIYVVAKRHTLRLASVQFANVG